MGNNRKKMKNGTRIFIVTLLVSILPGLLLGGFSIKYMRDYMLSDSRRRLKSMAQIAASSMDGDVLESLQADDMGSEEYVRIQKKLQSFLADDDLVFVYTMRRVGNQVQFLVDGDKEDPCAIGEPYDAYPKIHYAFDGQITLDNEITRDQWGEYYSAFAPIRNSEGRVVAIAGVDCTVQNINAKLRSMTSVFILFEGICILICTSLSVVAAKKMDQYVNEAFKDGLTGLYNRRYAVRQIDDPSRENQPYGFLLMDIDYFKEVNDTCGHRVGDRVLVGLAGVLQKNIQKGDIGFRLGGDEFALYFPREMSQQELQALAETIITEFKAVLRSACPSVTEAGISLGGLTGMGSMFFGELYHNADKLLYQVKNQGKGKCLTAELDFRGIHV